VGESAVAPCTPTPTLYFSICRRVLIARDDVDRKADLHALMLEKPDHAAVVRFNMLCDHVQEFIERGTVALGPCSPAGREARY
jgi:hypothetical protein